MPMAGSVLQVILPVVPWVELPIPGQVVVTFRHCRHNVRHAGDLLQRFFPLQNELFNSQVFVTNIAYDTLFPAIGTGALQLGVKWAIAILLILPQSVLLGATFPLMSAGVLRRFPSVPGRTGTQISASPTSGSTASVTWLRSRNEARSPSYRPSHPVVRP